MPQDLATLSLLLYQKLSEARPAHRCVLLWTGQKKFARLEVPAI